MALLQEGNPIIRHKFTADPTAIVVNNEVYLYTGHDDPPVDVDDYVMNDWLCFSSANLVDWKEHPLPLKATDFAWASGDAFASKVVQKDGRFYWFVAVSHATIPGKAIGVAVADTSQGPFTDAKGSALITGDMLPVKAEEKTNLDPSVLIDDDGQATIFWGNERCFYAPLHSNMTELAGDIKEVLLPGFAEGVHVHKRNGWYYLSYGYGTPEKVAYAMSRSIDGPWEFKGILNEIAGNCETNRPCIIDFKEQSYFIYHNGGLKGGGSHRRSVCIDRLFYKEDGTMQRVIMTTEGVGGITNPC